MNDTDDWPRRGDVWWAYTPGQPNDPHQPRPCVIVSVNARNARADDVIAVPVFSTGRPGPTRVILPRGIGGLPHESIAFCEEVTTLQHQFLTDGPIGRAIPANVLDQLVTAIIDAIAPE